MVPDRRLVAKVRLRVVVHPELIAAISVAVLLIPESMGVPLGGRGACPDRLYAAPLALIGYALFGGSRLLVFATAGSVAAVSAGVITGLHPPTASP